MLKKLYTLLFSLIATFGFSQTVMEIIESSPNHNTLEMLINSAGLNGALSDANANLTVFAPTDAAFAEVDAAFVGTLTADPTGKLARALLYHVLGSEVFSNQLSNGQTAPTLLGQDITVTIDMGVFINTASQVTGPDNDASNGVVHIVNGVLLPPALTVADVVINSPDHTILETAVIDAGLAGTLGEDGAFTVFAPTDAAFMALDQTLLGALLADPTDSLAKALLYHVLEGEVLSSSLSNGQTATTLLGQDITVTVDMSGVFINGAQVSVADIRTLNGVVHVLDAVILPPSLNVAEVVINSPVHTILETAVIDAGLAGTLQTEGPFTVFAPTDNAFQAMDQDLLNALVADPTDSLAKALLYHVVSGEVLSSSLSDGQTATTLLGQDITVTVDMNGVFINGAQVSIADIRTFNGVVHVLDAVILPPALNVAEVVINSPVHTILETAVIDAGLAGTLQTEGPFTVFAPTDNAFQTMDQDLLNALVADPTDSLAKALLYHVVAGEVLSSSLSDGQTATTLLGQDITVTVDMNGVSINGAQVSIADIRTFNGVVHVLDAVMLPPALNIVDVVVNSANHTILEDAVIDAGLAGTLAGEGPFTLFAPTDAAFAMVDPAILNPIVADPTGDLAKVLQYHVLSGETLSSGLLNGQFANTLLGQDILFVVDNTVLVNNEALVTVADIRTFNGVVHIIDAVLLPNLTSVKDLNQVNISVAPNPTTDLVRIDVPQEMLDEKVQGYLIGMNGVMYKEWNPRDVRETVNVSTMPPGAYLLLLKTDKQFARTTLIIN